MLPRCSSVVLLCLASSSAAFAQAAPDAPAPAEPAATDPNATGAAPAPAPTPAPAPAPAPAASTSGLRNGFSLSAGQEFGGDRDISATLFGLDWRIGWRINEPIAVYLHSHLSFGSGKEGNGASGLTGNFAAALVGEYMLPMRLFVGAGAGYGVLNNPSGALVEARVGYYPLKTNSVGKARRLNIAFDYRAYFASDGYGMVNHVALSLGYDRF
ncbi:MAG TPA: hypothetical protein VNO30_36150 [Kofleriaceae bacterium]|nr:hypothetical protein [Kofleriaceae bacterium]